MLNVIEHTHRLCQYQFPRFDIVKSILYSFFTVSVTNSLNLVALNNANLLSHSSVGEKSGHHTIQLLSLFLASQSQNQGVGRAELFSRSSGLNPLSSSFRLLAEFSSMLLQNGDLSLLPCWLLATVIVRFQRLPVFPG